jgi:DUF4097 and DUF4098 domain-containing protein YvlB
MKKISILIVLAMILTIGGVYATWNYAQGNVEDVSLNPVVSLTEKVVDTAKGTIAVDASGLTISIDDANNDYDAELVMTGNVNVTFTADTLASAEVKANGIKLQYTLTVTTPWEYEGTQVFTVEADPIAINNGAATFTATITADELMDAITLGDISLPTPEAYDAFEAILANGNITITVSEAQ